VGSLGGVFWASHGWIGVTSMTSALLLVGIGLSLQLRARAD
jgi:hypothetical protein